MENKKNADIQSLESGENSLEVLTWDNLSKWNIALGDIYWEKSDGKRVKLHNAGEFYSPSKLVKFFEKNYKLLYRPAGSQEHRELLQKGLSAFLLAKHEPDRLKHRRQLLGLIKFLYWDSFEDSSLLDLVLVFDKKFNVWVDNEEDHFLYARPDVNKRNALVGGLNALGGILLSYNHPHYLQDLYNVVYLVDYSYKEKMTPRIFELLDDEHLGEKEFLKAKEKLTESEKKDFDIHALKDYELAVKNFAHLFNYESSLLFVKRHHEMSSGLGSPLGVNQEELSDVELWGILVSRLFSWRELHYVENDGEAVLKKVLSLKIRENSKIKDFVGRRISLLVKPLMDQLLPVKEVA